MKIPLCAFVPFLLFACASPRIADSIETVRLPLGTTDVRVHDRIGARVVAVEIERSGDAWTLSGTLHGAWLETASRRTVRVEALDASGAKLASGESVARLFADSPRKTGIEAARFALAVPDPAVVARYEISVVGP